MKPMDPPLLSVRDLQVTFQVRSEGHWPWSPANRLQAVAGVGFDLREGETLGIVGESGCGKSTLARAILNLVPASGGQVAWRGQVLDPQRPRQWAAVRREAQIVFQDPLASLDPRMNILQIVGEPLRTHEPQLPAQAVHDRVVTMLERVGLGAAQLYRYPHEFSGGQCQRIGIARALILGPRLLVCDEPVSALDVSIQAQTINLLQDLQREMGLAMVFIAHDLAVVRHVSQRVLVMYLGRTMELASREALFGAARHPYTQALLSAVPLPDPAAERARRVTLLPGDLPSPLAPPAGCAFHTRCPRAEARCAAQRAPLQEQADRQVACWLA